VPKRWRSDSVVRGLHERGLLTPQFARDVGAELKAIHARELRWSLKRWFQRSILSVVGTLVVFTFADAAITGLFMAGLIALNGVINLIALRFPSLVMSRWFLLVHLIPAAVLGAAPWLALPPTLDGQTILLIFGALALPVMSTGLSAWRSLAIAWVVVNGATSVVAWWYSNHLFNTRLPEITMAAVAVVIVVLVDEHSRRHLRMAEESVATMANAEIDALTGVYRRAPFLALVDRALESGAPGSLFFIDVNRFKVINDTLGHQAGDQLLSSAALRLRRVAGSGDFIGRIGGDEFAVFMPAVSGYQATAVAERLRRLFDDDFELRRHRTAVAVSIGVASTNAGVRTAHDLMHYADCAMYEAKRSGSPVYFFDDVLRADLLAFEETELALRNAVRNDQIMTHLQPFVDARTGAVIGFEALGRWRRGDEVVPAAEWAESAQKANLFPDITRAVVADVIRRKRDLQIEVLPSVAINVEAGDLGAFLRWANVEGLHPGDWILEITESEVLANEADARRSLNEAASAGFAVVLDDFGTGYSSLTRLLPLPISGIKVDASFVRELDSNPMARAIVSAIARMSESCELLIVAEGVETATQAATLLGFGIPVMQGYYYCPPTSVEHAVAFANEVQRAQVPT